MLDSTKLLGQIMRMLNSDMPNVTQEVSVSPNTAIRETTEEVVIVLEVPGIQNREDIVFSITTTKAKIKGVRQKIDGANPQNANTGKSRQEFEKNINLPFPVRPETASAVYSKGILELKIKKLPEKIWDQVFVHFTQ